MPHHSRRKGMYRVKWPAARSHEQKSGDSNKMMKHSKTKQTQVSTHIRFDQNSVQCLPRLDVQNLFLVLERTSGFYVR